MQKNWIGKSFGCEIEFKIESKKPIDEVLSAIQQDLIHYLVFLFLLFQLITL
jgi:leucyl-tRNA synthetase